MLDQIELIPQSLDRYAASAGIETIAELRELAAPLRGLRVLHLNATAYGGGVAEILRSEIPLLRDLRIQADWRVLTGDEAFFSITKKIHNGLQGSMRELTRTEQETYLTCTTINADALEQRYDIVVVHDPQPLAVCQVRHDQASRWVWRCHIDTSHPNFEVWNFLRGYL